MIAITFALPAESSGIVSKLQSKRQTRENGFTIIFGNIEDEAIAIFHTGVGRKRCRQSIEPFLRSVRPELLISSGFAGGLTDEVPVGDLVIAQNFSDPELVRRLTTPAQQHIRRIKLLTVDRMVDSVDERARIANQDSAAAIDMETDVIAEACARNAIRMISLRVISDSPAAPFPAPPDVLFDLTSQRTNFGRLVPYVLTHPSAIGRLSRFAKQISEVRAILTDALVDVISNSRLG